MNTMKAQIEVDELVHMDEEDEDEGEFEVEADMFDNVIENGAEMKSRNVGHSNNPSQATRTSELTVAFEGEVYVFPAVTPEKGTLRDLKKGKRVTSFDQNEPETPVDIKPSYMEAENSYHIQDLQGSTGNAKSLQLESENSSMRPDEQDFLETAEASSPDYWPIQVDNSSVNLVDQDVYATKYLLIEFNAQDKRRETLDEFANALGSDFEIPANFDKHVPEL